MVTVNEVPLDLTLNSGKSFIIYKADQLLCLSSMASFSKNGIIVYIYQRFRIYRVNETQLHVGENSNHLKHTTTLFFFYPYILSREWRVIVVLIQTNYHGRPMVL